MIRLPLRLVPRSANVPILTGVNKGMRWIAGAGSTNSLWIGTFEADHFEALRKLVKPGMIAYDIGANVGYYTLALSGLVGDTGRIFAFEPEARNAYFLRRHIQMNRIQNVTIVQVAISDRSGIVGFEGGMERGKIVQKSAYQVASTTLDDFIAAGNPRPSFVKMDIQGAEQLALEGCPSTLSARKTVWILATHSDALKLGCCEVFARYGYTFRALNLQGEPGAANDFIILPPGIGEIYPEAGNVES